MAAILADVTTIFTSGIGWVGQVVTCITANPILEVFCLLPLVGLGIGLTRRLIRV
ncbi:MAG: hypothetical protein VB086_09360 [Clostridiaceae bacterium]|nr:hypothetical protein [Clostridiaceae bacterium]